MLLQDPQRKRELFGVLRSLLRAAQPDRPGWAYLSWRKKIRLRIEQSLMLHFAAGEVQDVLARKKAPCANGPTLTPTRPARGVASGASVPWCAKPPWDLLGPQARCLVCLDRRTWDLAHSPTARSATELPAWINLIQRRQMALLYRAWADTQAHGNRPPGESHPLADRL